MFPKFPQALPCADLSPSSVMCAKFCLRELMVSRRGSNKSIVQIYNDTCQIYTHS